MRAVAVFALGLGLAAGAGQARAAAPPFVVWQGAAFVTSVTSQCTAANDATVGDAYLIEYRPIISGSASNPATNDEGISFFGVRNAVHYSTAVGKTFRTAGTANLVVLGSRATSASGTAAFSLAITPAAITTTTQTVTITGQVNNFFATAGCDIKFTSALDRRNN